MFCSHCNKEISDNALFCPECGQRVSKPANTDILTPGTSAPAPETEPKPAFVPASYTVPDPTATTASEVAAEPSPVSETLTPNTPAPAVLTPASLAPDNQTLDDLSLDETGLSDSTVPAPAPFVPQMQSPDYQNPQSFFVPAPIPTMPAFAQPEVYEESGYYHMNAAEVYDFEAMRGISIALIVISAMTIVGVLFPMPLAIISLVKACGGLGERNTSAAASRFSTCKILTIVTLCTLLAFVIAGIVLLALTGSLMRLADVEQALF